MSIGKRLYEHKKHLFFSPTHIKQREAKNNKYYAGGSFPNLEYELLNLENRNHLPIFRNYEDLREILTLAFQMFEDMTTEFLKVYGDLT